MSCTVSENLSNYFRIQMVFFFRISFNILLWFIRTIYCSVFISPLAKLLSQKMWIALNGFWAFGCCRVYACIVCSQLRLTCCNESRAYMFAFTYISEWSASVYLSSKAEYHWMPQEIRVCAVHRSTHLKSMHILLIVSASANLRLGFVKIFLYAFVHRLICSEALFFRYIQMQLT